MGRFSDDTEVGTMMGRVTRAMALFVGLILNESSASAQLVFNITNDSSNPATAQMITGMQQAAAMWSAVLTDSITINIRIASKSYPAGTIGHTDTFYDPYTYSSVRTALINDRTSATDLSATNAMQAGPAISMLINKTKNNPNGVVSATPYFDTGLGGAGQAGPENNNTVRISSANAKAIGLYPANAAGNDGIITFTSTALFDFNRSDGITSNKIDFVGAAAHEIGHLLGFTSGVDVLATNSTAPGLNDNQLKYVTTLDLFRFSSRSIAIGSGGGTGVIDWTDDSFAKYFSVDGGATAIAPFSTGSVNEASHWGITAPVTGIMDPTVVGGELLSITSSDLLAFDAIGYNLVAVPEPSFGIALGLAALGMARQWRIRSRSGSV